MPHPHPSWEVEQLIRTRILEFHAWLTSGLAMPPGEGQPTCKDIAVEAVAKIETFYNIIQNGEQYQVLTPEGGTVVDTIFPSIDTCSDCPPEPVDNPK